ALERLNSCSDLTIVTYTGDFEGCLSSKCWARKHLTAKGWMQRLFVSGWRPTWKPPVTSPSLRFLLLRVCTPVSNSVCIKE
ncbi:MAG: hypothetical protein ACK55I_48065, partial [bacterium]